MSTDAPAPSPEVVNVNGLDLANPKNDPDVALSATIGSFFGGLGRS